MNYTNAQLRNILNGLGHRTKVSGDGSNFPLTNDDSPLTDAHTQEAIKKFQQEYQLVVDGIAGPKTMAMAERVIRILQDELNRVVKAGLPSNQPFYGPLTVAAVKRFQSQIHLPQDGVASYPVRVKLYELVQRGAA